MLSNKNKIEPHSPIYNLSFHSNKQKEMSLAEFKGKKLLLVNTASACGYTPQYKELQQLQERFRDDLMVIGFPANDFKEQEKLNDDEIAAFCEINFGVTFPLAAKSTVIKGSDQNKIFQWLSSKEMNGWNDNAPKWNFSKYLVNEEGLLTHYFDASISPLAEEVVEAINFKG
jgi:glutathione peroxidase